jgi:hypothetical protein
VAAVDLLVEMGELAPSVAQEELALDPDSESQNVHEQQCRVGCDGLPVTMEDQAAPGHEELQLVHQTKAQREKNQRGDKNGIGIAWHSVPKRLIFVDVTDNNAERIGKQHRIRYFIAEAINDIRCPALTALHLVVAKRIEDFFKLDVSAIRSLPHIVEHHGLDFDVCVRGAGVEQEGLKRLGNSYRISTAAGALDGRGG